MFVVFFYQKIAHIPHTILLLLLFLFIFAIARAREPFFQIQHKIEFNLSLRDFASAVDDRFKLQFIYLNLLGV